MFRKSASLTICAALTAALPLVLAGFTAAQSGPASPEDAGDERNVALIRVFVKDHEKPRNVYSESGLKIGATILPDPFAYRAGKLYLAERDAGRSHADAIEKAAEKLKQAKQTIDLAGLRLLIENPEYKVSDKHRRIYTIQEKIPGKVLTLLAGGKSVELRLADKPANLREANVRIKKFWKLKDGRRKRLRIGDPDPDPIPVGPKPPNFEPILSKPMSAFVIEKDAVEVHAFFAPKALESAKTFEFRLAAVKKFEGPFEDDLVDLNDGRRWDPIEPITLKLDLPPGGTDVPQPLLDVLAAVKARL